MNPARVTKSHRPSFCRSSNCRPIIASPTHELRELLAWLLPQSPGASPAFKTQPCFSPASLGDILDSNPNGPVVEKVFTVRAAGI